LDAELYLLLEQST